MPVDYFSAAAALSLPTSPSPPTSPNGARASPASAPDGSAAAPPWTRNGQRSSAARRLSGRPYSTHRAPSQRPLTTRLIRTASALTHKVIALFLRLSPLQRALVIIALVALTVLSILGLVYSHEFFDFLMPIAKSWRELPFGWVILWLFTFLTAFPPMIGYSSACSLAGFIFGFPWGWPIVATASVAGSLGAFLTSRGMFSNYVNRLVGADQKFVALAQVLNRDGVGVLTMIRLCPLPFSLSNGFLATIPSIRPWAFAVATALASPKLAVHVFIGSRMALIIEEGDTMSTTDKIINYTSMVLSSILALVVSLYIYRRTMARAAELAAEEGDAISEAGGDAEGFADMATEASRLVNGGGGGGQVDGADEADAAALMDEDDISLWDTDGADGWGYRDSFSAGDEEAAIQGKGAAVASGPRK